MSYQDWFIIFIAVQFIHGLGTWKLYIKAGEKPWAAFVPVYNAIVLMRIINRKWWLVFLLFFPVINVMSPVALSVDAGKYILTTLSFTTLNKLSSNWYPYIVSDLADVIAV